MNTRRKMQFALLFLVLTGFSVVSLGYGNTDADLMSAVSAMNADDGNHGGGFGGQGKDKDKEDDSNYIEVTDNPFDAKVLQFLKVRKVCALTDAQAHTLADTYSYQGKTFDVNGNPINVLYLYGKNITKKKLTSLVGPIGEKNCKIIRGKHVLALITPNFVS